MSQVGMKRFPIFGTARFRFRFQEKMPVPDPVPGTVPVPVPSISNILHILEPNSLAYN